MWYLVAFENDNNMTKCSCWYIKKKKKNPQDVSSILTVQEKIASRKTKSGRKSTKKFTVVILGKVTTRVIF